MNRHNQTLPEAVCRSPAYNIKRNNRHNILILPPPLIPLKFA